MERPSIRQLECLVAIADHHSFRKAATAVGISQPALSAQIQTAERLLGIQVFENAIVPRSVLVTPAEVRTWSGSLGSRSTPSMPSAMQRGGAASPLVGPLRLGVIPTVAPYWLPSLLPAVRRQFPRLELILREDQTARLLAALGAGQLDLALVALPVAGDLTTAPIAHENFVVAAPRGAPILKRRALTERDLDDQTVLLLEDGHCLRDQALAVCERGGAIEAMEVRATSLRDPRPDGRRRARHHAAPRSRGGRARPAARSGRHRADRQAAAGAHDRPRMANLVGTAPRVPPARRRLARGSGTNARQAPRLRLRARAARRQRRRAGARRSASASARSRRSADRSA